MRRDLGRYSSQVIMEYVEQRRTTEETVGMMLNC